LREFDWLPARWNRVTVSETMMANGQNLATLELTATLDRFWATAFRAGAVWVFITVRTLRARREDLDARARLPFDGEGDAAQLPPGTRPTA